MPRFATSFVRVRRARFCARPAAGRFDRSGGPLLRHSANSPSRSSNSSRHVGLIAISLGYSLRYIRCRSHATIIAASRDLVQNSFVFVQHSVASLFDTGLCGCVCRRVAKFPQNGSRFTAQECDVALSIHSRQIHPNAQLPRPHFAGGVVGFAAHCQQRAVPCRQLLHQSFQPPLLLGRCRLQINQSQIDSLSHRLADCVVARRTHDRRPVLLMRCSNPKLCTACGGRYDQARMQCGGGTASSRRPCIRRYQDRRRARLQVTHEIWPIKRSFPPPRDHGQPHPQSHSQR